MQQGISKLDIEATKPDRNKRNEKSLQLRSNLAIVEIRYEKLTKNRIKPQSESNHTGKGNRSGKR